MPRLSDMTLAEIEAERDRLQKEIEGLREQQAFLAVEIEKRAKLAKAAELKAQKDALDAEIAALGGGG